MTVPEWAHFFLTEARHRAFVDAVERDLAGREAELALDEGCVRLLGVHDSAQVSFGLEELGQRWHALGEDAEGPTGGALIRAHFDAMWDSVRRRVVEPDLELEARLDDLEQARGLLRVRLFNERAAVALAVGLVQRRVARGLFAVLAFDLPEAVRPVEPARFERWGCGLDELWGEALERSFDAPVVVQKLRLFEQVPTLAVTGDTFFTTTQLLGLERTLGAQLDALPELGALVVVPTRHTLLAHPLGVHEVEVQKALHAMQKAGATLYEQGPGSLSPELYWWRGGVIEHIGAGRDEQGRLVLGAPEAFLREVVDGEPAAS
jgi:hypothetical protein